MIQQRLTCSNTMARLKQVEQLLSTPRSFRITGGTAQFIAMDHMFAQLEIGSKSKPAATVEEKRAPIELMSQVLKPS